MFLLIYFPFCDVLLLSCYCYLFMTVFSGCHSYEDGGSGGKPLGILVGATPISHPNMYFELGEKGYNISFHTECILY